MSDPQRLFHLALREQHAALGAVFVRHGEWSLPGHYGDADAEHTAIRERAALSDISHRSRIIVSGTDAGVLLDTAFSGHPGDLEEARASRSVALDEEGRISDVVLVARTGAIAFLVAGEPGQRETTLARLRALVGSDWDVRIEDRTESTCLLSLNGPAAEESARRHLSEGLPARLRPMQSAAFEFHGFRALAIRASATGEDGFELMLAPAVAQHVIETLTQARIPMAGHAALETARIEACIPAFEPDLATGLTPAEADLDVILGVAGGADRRLLSALLLDGEEIPGAGSPVLAGDTVVGEVRSACRSGQLNATIALAVLDVAHAHPGVALRVGNVAAFVSAKPFVRRRV